MNKCATALAASALTVLLAACTTPAQHVVGGVVLGSLAGSTVGAATGKNAAFNIATTDQIADAPSDRVASAPEYGWSKKPHNHCGNGTMVHLGSVICKP